MKLTWKRKSPHVYVAKGEEATYEIERMWKGKTSQTLWVGIVDGHADDPFQNLRLAKASAQAFEDSYATA